VKTNGERLRDALGVVRDKAALHVMESESGNIYDWIFVRDVSAKALGATTSPTDMQQLVEWLETEHHKHRHDAYMRDTLQYVLDHIREMQEGEQPRTTLTQAFAELRHLCGKDFDGIEDVVEWVRQVRGKGQP